MAPPAVRVRDARAEDLPGVLEVYNHYVVNSPATFEVTPVTLTDRRPWYEEHTSNGLHHLVVAVEPSGRVVGWATTSPFRPRAAYATTVEASVYCRPGFGGRGIGTVLYESLFASVKDQDIERIVAGITLPNRPSVRLHQRFGFQRVGTFHRVGRKFDQYWDVAWFERPLRWERPQVPAA